MASWFNRCVEYFRASNSSKGSSRKEDSWKKPTVPAVNSHHHINQPFVCASDDSCKQHLITTSKSLPASSFICDELERDTLTRFTSRSTDCCSSSRSLIQDDECVICLGEFSVENPQVFTLCSCGENRSKFHYPCLVLWMERKQVCPTCDQSLFYQEGVYNYSEEEQDSEVESEDHSCSL